MPVISMWAAKKLLIFSVALILLKTQLYIINMMNGAGSSDDVFRPAEHNLLIALDKTTALLYLVDNSSSSFSELSKRLKLTPLTTIIQVQVLEDPVKNYLLFKLPNETRAVKRFHTKAVELDPEFDKEITFLKPTNIDEFVWRWKRGRFFECRRELAEERYYDENEYRRIPLKFIEKMSAFQETLAKNQRTIFMIFGTLLGWRRECSIIPHTLDVDFGLLARENSTSIEKVFEDDGTFILGRTLGKPENSFEMGYYVDKKVRIDLFYVYDNKENSSESVSSSYRFNPAQRLESSFPKIDEICAVDLLNHLMFAPCDIDAQIEANYGKDWRYDFDSDQWVYDNLTLYSNVKEKEIYTNDEFWAIYKEYFDEWKAWYT